MCCCSRRLLILDNVCISMDGRTYTTRRVLVYVFLKLFPRLYIYGGRSQCTHKEDITVLNAKVTLFAAFAYCTNLITLTFFFVGSFLFPSSLSPLSEKPTDSSFCFAIIAKDFHFFHCHYSPLRTFAYRVCVSVYFSYMIEESCSALISCKIKVFYNLRTILHNINLYSFTFCALVVFSVFL